MQKTGQACTALAFSLRRTTEFLVALADNTIKCFDKGRLDLLIRCFIFLVVPSRDVVDLEFFSDKYLFSM